MKKHHDCTYLRFSTALSIFIFLFAVSTVVAVPAFESMQLTKIQPDGSSITISPVGDETNGRYITTDGYTVLKGTDGFYYFATSDNTGKLILSDTKASNLENRDNNTKLALNKISKDINLSDNRLVPTFTSNPQPIVPSMNKSVLGTYNVLIITVDFTDQLGVYPIENFERLMNEPGYDVYGSVNDFYRECSYDQFGVNGVATGWYTAFGDHYRYGYGDGDNWRAAAELAREAILAALSNGVDFSIYDNDGDGNVDGLFIVHAGPGAETGASEYPWSHRWSLRGAGLNAVTANGVTINDYTMEPELHSGSELVRIGVFAHEYGHALNLPDLYDTDGSSSGIGPWGVMSGGSWGYGGKSPAHFCAWSKIQLGWVEPINIEVDQFDVVIPDAENNPIVYRLWEEGMMEDEYFLVEYRKNIMFDRSLPSCGIAIWHIDDNLNSNTNDSHRLVDLEEADNSETNSRVTDLWIDRTFNYALHPNSQKYNGELTRVEVSVLSNSCVEEGMHANLLVGVDPPCCNDFRGNVNYDKVETVDIDDVVYLVDFAFGFPSGPDPLCFEEADVDGSGVISIDDVVYLIDYAFGIPSGPQPPDCP